MHIDFQCVIVQQFLPYRFKGHFQINLIVVRSRQFASLVPLGLCRFSDIDFISEKLCRFSSVRDKSFLFRKFKGELFLQEHFDVLLDSFRLCFRPYHSTEKIISITYIFQSSEILVHVHATRNSRSSFVIGFYFLDYEFALFLVLYLFKFQHC